MTSSGIELRIGNKYRVGRKIGSGSFGDIYLGENRNRVIFFFPKLCWLCVGFVRGQHESIRVTKITHHQPLPTCTTMQCELISPSTDPKCDE